MNRPDNGPKPKRLRYRIVAVLFLLTVINYADRSAISIAAAPLAEDLGLGKVALGFIFSAFGWAYVLAQIPGGYLLDRFGSRPVYIASILLWSACTAAQGLVGAVAASAAFALLFGLRFLLGLVEAPSFPANARIVAAWFPTAERGTATAIFNSAQYIAVALFAPLMAWMVHALGWQAMFVVMGALGVIGAFVFGRTVHPPLAHRKLEQAELDHISKGGGLVDLDAAAIERGGRKGFSWEAAKPLVRNRMLLGIYFGQYCITALTYFFSTWFPVYLVEQRGMSILEAGLSASIPAVCGWIGGILGGVWSDALLRRGWSLTAARKIPIVSGLLISTIIVGCNFVDAGALVILFMAAAYFGKGVAALGWVVIADSAPRETTGLAGGIFNAIGNTAGIVIPIMIGFIVARTGSFDLALVFLAAHSVLGILSYLLIVGPIARIGGEAPRTEGAAS